MSTEAAAAERKKRYFPTGDERTKLTAEMVQLYQKEPGEDGRRPTVRAVAEQLGQSYGLTHRILLEAGALRSKSARPKP